MTAGKRAEELEGLIMAELRGNPKCSEITGVVVTPEGAPGEWRIAAIIRNGTHSMPDADRALIFVAHALRQKFHLETD